MKKNHKIKIAQRERFSVGLYTRVAKEHHRKLRELAKKHSVSLGFIVRFAIEYLYEAET